MLIQHYMSDGSTASKVKMRDTCLGKEKLNRKFSFWEIDVQAYGRKFRFMPPLTRRSAAALCRSYERF